MNKVALIIPAHNEQDRIGKTLQTYCDYFNPSGLKVVSKPALSRCEASYRRGNVLNVEFIVVLNACTDNTADVVKEIAKHRENITMLDFKQCGKGFAITQGFRYALKTSANFIGFVDADMATSPHEFFKLIEQIKENDGIIASRYIPDSIVTPPRPLLKRWGSKLIYEPLVQLVLGLNYKDLQCGAKLFKRDVIEVVTNQLSEHHWAFDIELLYLCKQYGFTIKEVPTVWHDQAASKLSTIFDGLRMLSSILAIRKKHSSLRK